jgi:hypothetical protein
MKTKAEPDTYKIKIFHLDMMNKQRRIEEPRRPFSKEAQG